MKWVSNGFTIFIIYCSKLILKSGSWINDVSARLSVGSGAGSGPRSGEWEICIITRFYIPNNCSIDDTFEQNLKLNEIGEMIVKIFYQRFHEVLFRTYTKEA